MNLHALERTRRALHGVAELVLAGPQYERSGDIRLRVTPGGFGTVATPELRVDHVELVTPKIRLPLAGTFAGLARAAEVDVRPLRDVYSGGPDVNPDDPIILDPQAANAVIEAFAAGDAAMRAFAPDLEPVLWPEHFDVGITVAQVNYGVSPGDVHIAEPYAYVGPWTRLVGAFWNMEFGAAMPLTELDDVQAVVAFFEKGASEAAAAQRARPDA
jgi:hypothetical protein